MEFGANFGYGFRFRALGFSFQGCFVFQNVGTCLDAEEEQQKQILYCGQPQISDPERLESNFHIWLINRICCFSRFSRLFQNMGNYSEPAGEQQM